MNVNIEFSPAQTAALYILDQPYIDELLYGGAKGGGKSTLGCLWVYIMADRIIQEFKLSPSKQPVTVGFMGRRQASDFFKTTLDTWQEWIPPEEYKLDKKYQEITIRDTVKIYYGGLDSKKNISKFNSGQFGFAFVDQAEEIEEERLVVELRSGLRRMIGGVPLPRKILWTANPRVCWLKAQFVDKKEAGKAFLPALPYDNPHLPEWYIPKMEEDLKYMPELLRAYRDGSWEILGGADQLIQERWINEAKDIKLNIPNRCIISIDPARFGDDELVIYGMINSKIIDEHHAGYSDTNYILREIENMAFKMQKMGYPPSLIICDTTGGWGAGVEDNINPKLRLWNFPCKFMGFNFAERQSSGVPEGFYNRRAQIFMNAQKMFASHQIEMNFDYYPELKRQLMQFKYDYRGGKTYIQGKSEIKKLLGRSPDQADCYCLGLFGLEYATPVNKKEWEITKSKKEMSWMAY